GQMALTPKDETVRLGFGVDDKIKVARTLLRKNESSSGLISTTRIDEREFKITVRNGHDAPIRVMVEDQLPVSEIEDVKIETLPSTTSPTERDTRNRRGVLAWSFTAAAGELKEINFGWRVRWPDGKQIVYQGGRSGPPYSPARGSRASLEERRPRSCRLRAWCAASADHPPISGLPEIGIFDAQVGQGRLAWLASLAPQDDGSWMSSARLPSRRQRHAGQHQGVAGGGKKLRPLAEKQEGEDRAEHRHQVDERRGAVGADQLDAAVEEEIGDHRRKDAEVGEGRERCGVDDRDVSGRELVA